VTLIRDEVEFTKIMFGMNVYAHFSNSSCSNHTWTLNCRMMRQVFYPCVTTGGLAVVTLIKDKVKFAKIRVGLNFFMNFSDSSCCSQTWTLNRRMMRQVFYHCVTTGGLAAVTLIKDKMELAKIRVGMNVYTNFYDASSDGQAWTLNLAMIRQVFYHCATTHSLALVTLIKG
jgi:hypothetical protein